MPKVQRSPPSTAPATPVSDSQTARSNTDTMNVTLRGRNRNVLLDINKEDNSSNDSLNLFTSLQDSFHTMLKDFEARQDVRLSEIENKMSLIKLQNDGIKNTNQEIEKSIVDVSARIEQVQSTIIRMEDDRKQLSNQILKIEDKCEALEKNLIKTCIEIRSVPKVKNESKADLYNYIKKLSDTLKLKVEHQHVRDIYRLPNKRENDTSTIILELCNTYVKTNILEACRTLYKSSSAHLNASNLGLANSNTRIFISEHLTSKGRRLFYLSKTLKNDKRYDYCWTAGGNVYLRKSEGDAAILVRNEDQLIKLRKEL